MKEYIVDGKSEGLTLHHYLQRVLPGAGGSLLYKQLRKKNINLNKRKANGSERLVAGDSVQVFFSDETITKFEGEKQIQTDESISVASGNIDVIFENEDILIINKPADMLSQKAEKHDISLNEEMLAYLLKKGEITEESMKICKPSVCNRLDRNTSGIVLCGKTIKGLQSLSLALKDRSAHKYYRCVVVGEVRGAASYEGFLTKARSHNQVRITKEPVNEDSQYICTKYRPLGSVVLKPAGDNELTVTCLEVLLVTGRSHQIRAHLASIGHPIAGDPKYGKSGVNKYLRKHYGVKRQLLHAYRILLPGMEEIKCPLPADMSQFFGFRKKYGDLEK